MKNLFHYLQKTVLQHAGAEPTDGQLLECFLARQDESAFTSLVQRHGPMVLAVARRLLGNTEDAEDVFQATFLVLVRKAGRIARRDLLGNWLYGVAYRTALEARRLRARRQARERQVDAVPDPIDRARQISPELPAALDAALSRLADKYRTAIVLCDLQGRSRQEAARQLCIPEGTLSSRLATGRRKLAQRLARQGLTLTAPALAASLSETGSACPPAPLVLATLQSAQRMLRRSGKVPIASAKILSLVEGVMRAMFLHKVKVSAAGVLGLGLIALVLGALLQQAWFSTPSLAADPPQGQPTKVLLAQGPAKGGQPAAKGEPKLSDIIQPGDRLKIHVPDALPNAPIMGIYQVEASGKVALGAPYGRVMVKGLSLEEAEQKIFAELSKIIKDPLVSLTRYDPPLDPAAAGQIVELKAKIATLELRIDRLETEMQALKPGNAKPKVKKEAAFTAGEVVDIYKANNAALAVDKLQDKRVAVTGEFLSISGGEKGIKDGIEGYSYDLSMGGKTKTDTTSLVFGFFVETDSPEQKQLAKLKPGQVVTIEALCTGQTGAGIFFRDSKFLYAGK